MSDYKGMLDVGDRVAMDRDGMPPLLGTVVKVCRGSRPTFSIKWDTRPSVDRGWLRFALRKIPNGTHTLTGR